MSIEVESEEWRDVIGYNGYYQVSNLGRVKSLERDNRGKKFGRLIPETILREQKHHKNGYRSVLFKIGKHQKRFTTHSLVANAFIHNDDPDHKLEINHKDTDKGNNRVENLEWSTRQWNCVHALLNGLREENTLQRETIAIQDTAILTFKSILKCAQYLRTSHRSIRRRIDTGLVIKGHLIYSIPKDAIAI